MSGTSSPTRQSPFPIGTSAKRLLVWCICALTLALLACNATSILSPTQATPTPSPAPTATAETPTPTQPTLPTKPADESERRCGDGVCDGPENADNCPADCAAESTAPPPTPTRQKASPTPQPVEPTATAQPSSGAALVSLPGGILAVEGDPTTLKQEGGAGGVTQQTNVAFILDGSGSMKANLAGSGRTKLAVAKEVLSDLVAQVPPEVHGTLWIYGHRYPQEPKETSCRDIEQVFPLGPVDAEAYVQAIRGIDAIGYTPIADSMTMAAENLPAGEGQSNSIILVSDGKETCGGDPCALAAALKKSDANVTIHVVGYAVDEETREQLQCIAHASGGTYSDASSADLLREALEGALDLAQSDTLLRLEVVGPQKHQVDARLVLYESGTDESVGGMNAWSDNVVAPGAYDIVVETVPPVFYSRLEIPEGSSTLIRLEAGSFEFLGVEGEAITPYQVNVLDPVGGDRLGYLLNPGDDPYFALAGSYNLALYPDVAANDPQATFRRVVIKPLKHAALQLGAFDLRGVKGEALRPSAITFHDPTSDEPMARFTQTKPELYYLAPGPYRVGYTLSWTCAYESGWLEDVIVRPGETTAVTLGAYVFHDADGQPTAYAHTLIEAASGEEIGHYCGQVERNYAPPGTYDLQARFTDFTVEGVVIKAGEEIVVNVPE